MLNDEKFSVTDQESNYAFSISDYADQVFEGEAALRLLHNRILFVREGSGVLMIDNYAYNISGRQIFLMAKDQSFHIRKGASITGYELNFDEFFWEKAPASASNCKSVLFDNAAVNQLLPLDRGDFKEIAPIFRALWREDRKPDYINKPDALAAYLKIMMIKMANINAALKAGFDNYEYQQYRQFYDLIGKDFMVSREVDYYAAELNISSRKLTTLCKRYSGKGAKELINSKLMAEAKRYLQFSSNPVKDIAFRLRFSTPEQFSHFFKKNAAQSPQHYRRGLVKTDM
ncbi:helix-turn-helix domain-containing protein [Pedobacter hartonius]|uniref:AraC-type DNA-binding protein n=1 Tax=Pedobacter hartonius TaxID=425514 RepID=A0A1H4BBH3_9SPHI|nr:helix-turn-helix domain-containing protein [Pedobacter hartonius]SEA45500.1 AraC-type DNA-binding protein [Pedobacter hartonius]